MSKTNPRHEIPEQSHPHDVGNNKNGARKTGFHRGQRLVARDHLVSWPKPKQRLQWMTAGQFEACPNELTLRETKVKGQVLVTTLLDDQDVRKQACKRGPKRSRWLKVPREQARQQVTRLGCLPNG